MTSCCRGPNVVIDDGQVEVPNSQLISCLDSSLGRASACGAGGQRFLLFFGCPSQMECQTVGVSKAQIRLFNTVFGS